MPPKERVPSGYERPSLSSLLIYYIRILLLGFVYMVLVHLFLSPDGLLYRVAVWVWAVSFALLWLLYFPIKYWKHRYKLEGNSLYVASGVIYTRFHHIRLPLIQLVSVTRSPLQYLFGVATLCVCRYPHLCLQHPLSQGGHAGQPPLPCPRRGQRRPGQRQGGRRLKHHTHPITILQNMGSFLFLLIIPLARGALSFGASFSEWLSGAWVDGGAALVLHLLLLHP